MGLHHVLTKAFTWCSPSCRRHARSDCGVCAAVPCEPAIVDHRGYLTENYGWQTIFFVNTAPSAVMVIALASPWSARLDETFPAQGGDMGRANHHGDGLSALQDRCWRNNKERLASTRPLFFASQSGGRFLSAFVAIELQRRSRF